MKLSISFWVSKQSEDINKKCFRSVDTIILNGVITHTTLHKNELKIDLVKKVSRQQSGSQIKMQPKRRRLFFNTSASSSFEYPAATASDNPQQVLKIGSAPASKCKFVCRAVIIHAQRCLSPRKENGDKRNQSFFARAAFNENPNSLSAVI